MTLSEVNKFIRFSTVLSNNDLNSIIDAVKYARSRLQKQTIRSLSIGDNVNFTSTRTGQNLTGVVTKIAIKYITVRTVNGLWRVPANMITVVESESRDPMDDFNYVGSRHHY
jgi:small-conductance mechanosensitive channel